MVTSVPGYRDVEDTKQVMARLMELAFEAARLSGDGKYLREPVRLLRRFYEEELKVAGNTKRYDWRYIEQIRLALERVEQRLAKYE